MRELPNDGQLPNYGREDIGGTSLIPGKRVIQGNGVWPAKRSYCLLKRLRILFFLKILRIAPNKLEKYRLYLREPEPADILVR